MTEDTNYCQQVVGNKSREAKSTAVCTGLIDMLMYLGSICGRACTRRGLKK
jgi:hypothetical protein